MPQQEYEIITGIVITIIVFLLCGFFILALVAYINQRKKKHFEEKQKMQSNFEQEILRTQLEIQEQTLKNISQEIHDNVGQVLSLAKLNLATTDIIKTENAQQKVDDSRDLVAKAIQDLRDLSKSLNTDYVADMGLARSIEYELEMISKTGSFETRFDIEGIVYKLEQQQELILFRIVQELLNNILKHSKASLIHVKLDYLLPVFSIRVIDNGDGFDPGSLKGKGRSGLGIRNMQNRALLIGAGFEIDSAPGKGTRVKITVSITNQGLWEQKKKA
jgi:two-component system, NarL family, sensor kinase